MEESPNNEVWEARKEPEYVGPNKLINREEYIRLLQQSLRGLGFTSIAKNLEDESGVPYEDENVEALSAAVLAGDWKKVQALLESLQVGNEENMVTAKFSILTQKYLEALESSDTDLAVHTLQVELAPLSVSNRWRQQLHFLASLLLKHSPLLHQMDKGLAGRQALLRKLQQLLPTAVRLPEDRLQVLVEQALQRQRAECIYHNTNEHTFSLLTDHRCSRDRIPTKTVQVLEDHLDEVWHIQFSHNGKYLASASKDCTAIIWEVSPCGGLSVLHVLRGHTDSLAFVAWSPDDDKILTCGNDCHVNLWEVSSGTCLRNYAKHTNHVTACAWLPCGTRFVSGGHDKNMYLWDIEGNELYHWAVARINDLAITSGGRKLVSTCSEKKLRSYDLETHHENAVEVKTAITSISASRDGHFLLANLASQQIQLWEEVSPPRLKEGSVEAEQIQGLRFVMAYKFCGQSEKQGRFVIRSCFGGSEESFVVSGSEDSLLYIWHLQSGNLLDVLPGHCGTINAVSWNPARPTMFASASDDHTIRIWGCASDVRDGALCTSAPTSMPQCSNGHLSSRLEGVHAGSAAMEEKPEVTSAP